MTKVIRVIRSEEPPQPWRWTRFWRRPKPAVPAGLDRYPDPGDLLKNTRTGETMLFCPDWTMHRAFGAVRFAPLVAGDELIRIGNGFADAPSLRDAP